MATQTLLSALHELIGLHGRYQGDLYRLIDIIDKGPSIVLEAVSPETIMQNTIYGDANRYSKRSYTVPLFSEVKADLHPVITEFLGAEICNLLLQLNSQP